MNDFLTFALSKNVVFDKVRLFTSYLAGKRAEDAVAYDRVAAIELDMPLLNYVMEECASILIASLNDSGASISTDADIIRLTLTNPLENGVPNQTLIYNLIESYIIALTITEWLRITGYEFNAGPESALKNADSVAQSKLSLLREALTPPADAPRLHNPIASPRKYPPI